MEKKGKLLNEIACLAYDLYERRGRAHGFALQDWLEAERIVMERYSGEIEREAAAITSGRKSKTAGAAKTKTGQTKKPAAKKKATASTAKKTVTKRAAPKKTE